MIDAKELMIGNWVTRQSSGNEYQLDANGIHDAEMYPKICSPIPLSKEWLTKLGFEETGDNLTLFMGRTFYAHKMDKEGSKYFVSCPILDTAFCGYVHQLQNLYFALTAKQLTTTE